MNNEMKDKLIKLLKEKSYYSDRVNWDKFSRKLSGVSELTLESLNKLLRLVDKHSLAVPKREASNKKDKRWRLPTVKARKCSKDIGILELPGFFTPFEEQYEVHFQDAVLALSKLKDKKYLILDLRENTGGNMYPWIAAFAPLYDTVRVGYFEYHYKKNADPWLIKTDGVYCARKPWTTYINKEKLRFEKIAILISSHTASSGEALTMSFVGQKNVKTFGEKTANYTTGNEKYIVGDFAIWLSTCVMQDRDRKSYPRGIAPEKVSKDPVKDAVSWFTSFV